MPAERILGLAALLLVLGGCASVTEVQAPEGLVRDPTLRLAVLPMLDRTQTDPLLGASLLDSDPLRKAGPIMAFRRQLTEGLPGAWLHPMDLAVLDSRIAHAGLKPLDAYAVEGRAGVAQRFCRALGVDALLICAVEAWAEGDEPALVEAELRHGSGRRMIGAQIVASSTEDALAQLVEILDPELTSSATPWAPGVRWVSHNASELLATGEQLEILAAGWPSARASFALGELEPVPMLETAPGTYRGVLTVGPDLRLEYAPLTVRLAKGKQTAELTIMAPPLWTAD